MGTARLRLDRLRSGFRGALVGPDDPRYDDARRVWNATADRRPALIARCTSPDDVRAALVYAREEELLVAVRGGAHSYPGFSTCDGGVVIDLSPMRRVVVDPERREATVAAGALLGELDAATQRYGLVCPNGAVSHTGVAGLTLGGGLGRLMRRFGLTVDSLLECELVTVDGCSVRASADENPELFWGLRGAGANFGVVTGFRYRLHPLGPDLVNGGAVWPAERAAEVFAVFGEWSAAVSHELTAGLAVGIAGQELGPALAGRPTIRIGVAHLGDDRAVEADLAPIRALAPALETFARIPYLYMQTSNDEYYRWGQRNHWKGLLLDALPDETLGILLDCVATTPSTHCGFGVVTMGGAVRQVSDDATAFSGRRAGWWLTTEALWHDAGDDEAHLTWGREAMARLRRVAAPVNYVNDLGEVDEHDLRVIYGPKRHARLAALKRTWDPDNVLQLNQNIAPAPPDDAVTATS